jgi:hypothetical protein
MDGSPSQVHAMPRTSFLLTCHQGTSRVAEGQGRNMVDLILREAVGDEKLTWKKYDKAVEVEPIYKEEIKRQPKT